MSIVLKRLKVLKPCRQCRDWGDCPGHFYKGTGEYYRLGEIQYCRHQVLWIIDRFLNYVGDSIITERTSWPDEFEASGYTQADGASPNVKASAPGEAVLQVVSEVSARLEATGKDGLLLVSQVRNAADLGKAARDALSYACGRWRKRTSYRVWLAVRGSRNVIKTITK